ncbi:hypothetical protein [Metabacillus litoralis]|uniref:hypothetical protein n=1 Tax=Metabacillus litoralis TaxID=152268 RepID=UPI00203A5E0B|nr:hypothetical protein [Metabacillus litoralis]MCM3413500.1 hypothetical protein [Metabacillus litoralis]
MEFANNLIDSICEAMEFNTKLSITIEENNNIVGNIHYYDEINNDIRVHDGNQFITVKLCEILNLNFKLEERISHI